MMMMMLPVTCHLSYIYSSEIENPKRNDAEMGLANLLHAWY